jgi:hypothetical protein
MVTSINRADAQRTCVTMVIGVASKPIVTWLYLTADVNGIGFKRDTRS